MSLPSVNIQHLTVTEIQPAHPIVHPDTTGENNTRTVSPCSDVHVLLKLKVTCLMF